MTKTTTRGDGHHDDGATAAASLAPGKRTLTESLAPALAGAVQRKAPPAADLTAGRGDRVGADAGHDDPFGLHLIQRSAAPSGATDDEVHAAARHGTSGSGGALPHAAAIQRSFGSFDVSGIRGYTDGAAAQGAAAMGANAYASGNDVAFAPGATDLHTAAHEAAHVVQQRAGVQLSGGVGAEGDAYERHADAVADRVVAGESAESLLAAGPGGAGAAGGMSVQRSAKATTMGTFTDEKYELEGTAKLHMTLKFTPGDMVDATKIGMIQTIKSVRDGAASSIDPAARDRQTGAGHAIDRLSDANTPVYGAPSLGGGQDLTNTPESNNKTPNPTELNPDNGRNATFQVGHRKKVVDAWETQDAGIYDGPTIAGGNNSSKEFETTAVALDGAQKDTYYGSVKWGWQKDGSGTVSMVDFDVVSMGVPSNEFMGAAEKWNAGKVRGTIVPKADDTPVYNDTGTEKYKVDAATEMTQRSTVNFRGVIHVFVEITSAGAHQGDTVYIKVSDAKDKGDGAALPQMPMVEVYCTTGATKVYKAADKAEELKTVPVGTRVKVLATSGDVKQVEIVDGVDTGVTGFVAADALVKE